MRRRKIAASLLVLAAATGYSATGLAAGAAKCEDSCLRKLVDSYFVALVAHDPGKAPIAPGARFVENTAPTRIGAGLWETASEVPGAFKIYVPDPQAQQVGFIGVLKEQGRPIEIGLRLKVESGQITEIEQIVVHTLRENGLKNLGSPRAAFLTTVPPAERTDHEQMLKIGASYYEAIVTSNGNAAPFAEDCVRHENGMQTNANPPPAQPGFGTLGALGCSAQLNSGVMSYIKRIEPRRVWIADVNTGLVFGMSQFRHPMKEKVVPIVGVAGVDHVDMTFAPFDLPAMHIFKIRGGKIHEIEALGFMAPYESKTGWE